MTAELSEYATTVPRGLTAWVLRIIWKSDIASNLPSMAQEALKILCRQCSLLAWANIMSSTSVGFRPTFAKCSAR